jgi:hypothetical protein
LRTEKEASKVDHTFSTRSSFTCTYGNKILAQEKEDFTASLVWIRLYSLPHEYWNLKILEGIGNTLGSFVHIEDATL